MTAYVVTRPICLLTKERTLIFVLSSIVVTWVFLHKTPNMLNVLKVFRTEHITYIKIRIDVAPTYHMRLFDVRH